jgi:hypothetical protein
MAAVTDWADEIAGKLFEGITYSTNGDCADIAAALRKAREDGMKYADEKIARLENDLSTLRARANLRDYR